MHCTAGISKMRGRPLASSPANALTRPPSMRWECSGWGIRVRELAVCVLSAIAVKSKTVTCEPAVSEQRCLWTVCKRTGPELTSITSGSKLNMRPDALFCDWNSAPKRQTGSAFRRSMPCVEPPGSPAGSGARATCRGGNSTAGRQDGTFRVQLYFLSKW